jgi:hypothetical protein
MGGGQLAVIVQQIGRPEAPAAFSSVLPPSSARVSRLRLIFFALFFILCSFRIVAVVLSVVGIVPHLAEGAFGEPSCGLYKTAVVVTTLEDIDEISTSATFRRGEIGFYRRGLVLGESFP